MYVISLNNIFFLFKYLFIWLGHVLVVACRILSLHCSIQDLYLQYVGYSSLTRDWTWTPALRAVS